MTQPNAPERDTAIHGATLQSLLSLGSPHMARQLLAQLTADFHRIGRALQSDDTSAVDRAAHELKGLSATVGANRLAGLAQVFDAAAANLGARARNEYRDQMTAEIDCVLRDLARYGTVSGPESGPESGPVSGPESGRA